jgi:hypothetical protein
MWRIRRSCNYKIVPNFIFFLHKFSENFSHPLANFLRWNSISQFILRLEIPDHGAHLSMIISSPWSRLLWVVAHLVSTHPPQASSLRPQKWSAIASRRAPLLQVPSAAAGSHCCLLVRCCVAIIWGSSRAKPAAAQCRSDASSCATCSTVGTSPTLAASSPCLGQLTPHQSPRVTID